MKTSIIHLYIFTSLKIKKEEEEEQQQQQQEQEHKGRREVKQTSYRFCSLPTNQKITDSLRCYPVFFCICTGEDSKCEDRYTNKSMLFVLQDQLNVYGIMNILCQQSFLYERGD